jgi:hypothetical protein
MTRKHVKTICERFGLAEWSDEFWRVVNGKGARDSGAMSELLFYCRSAYRCLEALDEADVDNRARRIANGN